MYSMYSLFFGNVNATSAVKRTQTWCWVWHERHAFIASQRKTSTNMEMKIFSFILQTNLLQLSWVISIIRVFYEQTDILRETSEMENLWSLFREVLYIMFKRNDFKLLFITPIIALPSKTHVANYRRTTSDHFENKFSNRLLSYLSIKYIVVIWKQFINQEDLSSPTIPRYN